MKTTALFLFLFLSTFAPALNTQAAIIGFESLQHADGGFADPVATYAEAGFLLTSRVQGDAHPTSLLTSWGISGAGFSGSTALFADDPRGETALTRVAGGWFTLNAITLAELLPTGDPFAASFIGVLYDDGSTVTQSFTLDGSDGAEMFVFDPAFSNLVSVSWVQSGDFFQFDNINAAPVPEPSTLLSFGFGLLTVAAARRKRG